MNTDPTDSLAYIEKGEGVAVVLLHGFCERKEIWKDTITHLSSISRVIAPDLPGFGDNPALTSSLSIEGIAAQVHHLLQDLGVDKGILVGHSLGGYAALAFAEQYPEWMQGLCLFHSTALPDPEEKKQKRNQTITFLEENGMETFAPDFIRGLFYQPEQSHLKAAVDTLITYAATTPLTTAIETTRAMRDRPDRASVLQKATYPLLLIAGKEDKAVPLATLREQIFMPGGSVYFQAVARTAHMGMFESKEATLEMLHTFVKQTIP